MAELPTVPGTAPSQLALRPRAAARALDIGESHLAALTKQGLIPYVRLGKRVIVYPVSVLEKWLADHATAGVQEGRP